MDTCLPSNLATRSKLPARWDSDSMPSTQPWLMHLVFTSKQLPHSTGSVSPIKP
ncbi:hypothetical protein BofuT4_uP027140.1 [Botrytis cinerea T4]|uniref:Uncharacterized protein n=1 Tax=Botryotinia fuckeliana (strain T4) TaxID=999810 RepID=G2YAT9_BOTF4|nr:hypothetical protein BofuT4_uP027140.1 [Botrytis cinerea T4]